MPPTTDSKYRYCSGRALRSVGLSTTSPPAARSSAASQFTSWAWASACCTAAMRSRADKDAAAALTPLRGAAAARASSLSGRRAALSINATACLHWRPTGQSHTLRQ